MRLDPYRLNTRTSTAVLRGLFRLFGGLDVRGLEHVPSTGPAIIATNHISLADGPALRAAMDRPTWFLAKAYLFDIPVLGRLFLFHGAFPIKQGDPDAAAMLWA